jgi:hypothetical protein
MVIATFFTVKQSFKSLSPPRAPSAQRNIIWLRVLGVLGGERLCGSET